MEYFMKKKKIPLSKDSGIFIPIFKKGETKWQYLYKSR